MVKTCQRALLVLSNDGEQLRARQPEGGMDAMKPIRVQYGHTMSTWFDIVPARQQ
jgi:hypothetical protein